MAEGVLNKIITWALIILFILIFLFVFYSPAEGFMGKIAKFALGAERFLPIEPNKEVSQSESLPESVKTAQEIFMKGISAYADKKECIIPLGSLSGLDNYVMSISNFENKVISRIILHDGRQGNPIKTKENIQICVVEPISFYQCYIPALAPGCPAKYNIVNLVEVAKDSVRIDGNSYQLMQYSLFKPDKDKICFIPFKDFSVSDNPEFPQPPKCESTSEAISGVCLDKIKEHISLCG